MKVMIVVTHLLGTGHLARALTLGRAYVSAGDQVCIVSGGVPVPVQSSDGMTFVQLPPVRSNGVDFTRLLTSDAVDVTQEYMETRQRALLETMEEFLPDILITELFPFGRRILRDEFTALLEQAKTCNPQPLICASIRDILAPPSKPKKSIFADEIVEKYYDAVLVHSDPAVTPLSLSWPVSDALAAKLAYTGFVAPSAAGPHPQRLGEGEVIVSAGGGDVGAHVFNAAVQNANELGHPLRLLIGGASSSDQITALRAAAPAHVAIEGTRPDFRQMLYHATASVSLCGYNTALDILQAGTPAVFIPFDEGNEVEQGLRADALAQRDGITTLMRANLSAQSLHDAIIEVIDAPQRKTDDLHFDGATQTVKTTHKMRNEM